MTSSSDNQTALPRSRGETQPHADAPAADSRRTPVRAENGTGPRGPAAKAVTALMVLCALAWEGHMARVLWHPSWDLAASAWLILTVALTALSAWGSKVRGRRLQPCDTACQWPEGTPQATIDATDRILSRALPARLSGTRLEIAPCPGPPGPCRLCRGAAGGFSGQGITVVLGEHLTRHRAAATFAVAHEIQHARTGTYLLSKLASQTCAASWITVTWLTAGWAVPWPWTAIVIAAVQACHTAAGYAAEIRCDLGAASIVGGDTAIEGLGHIYALKHDAAPGAQDRWADMLVNAVIGMDPHPPWWLRRRMITAFTSRHHGGPR